jgi:catechol 2,3-dioxygenase-like lactoylglutathione lyase family enzyme
LAALLLSLLWARTVLAASPVSVDAVAITVSDMDRALDFYTRVLPFEPVADGEVAGEPYERLLGVFGLRLRVARLRLGQEHVELLQFLAPRGRPIPPDSRSNDRWFQHVALIVRDMDAAYAHLRRHRVEHASPGPQRLPDWNPNAGGIDAFYFRDPDGNPLEILAFPPDKGEARWQRKDGPLFLGIDHTAIVVADTEASLALYRDRLGLQVTGTGENYGPEQERLNNVFGARLRITTLRAPSGPGVELLEYLAPRDGRPAPTDTRANDLWHGHVVLRVPSVLDTATALRAGRYPTISGAPVETPRGELGYRQGLLARDPDGHGLLLVE